MIFLPSKHLYFHLLLSNTYIHRMKSNTFKISQVLSAVTHNIQKSQDLTVNKKCRRFLIINFIKRKCWSTKGYRVHLHKQIIMCTTQSQSCLQPALSTAPRTKGWDGAHRRCWYGPPQLAQALYWMCHWMKGGCSKDESNLGLESRTARVASAGLQAYKGALEPPGKCNTAWKAPRKVIAPHSHWPSLELSCNKNFPQMVCTEKKHKEHMVSDENI